MSADLSPLLARESDQPSPWLSAGPAIPDESTFSRLITQTNIQIARRFPAFYQTPSLNQAAADAESNPSCVTVSAAVSLYTIFIGYVIAAYLAETWQETVLQVTVTDYEPVDFVLKQTTFASLLEESNNFLAMLFIWVSSLIIPVLLMVLVPLWMVHDFSNSVGAMMHPFRRRVERLSTTGFLIVWMFILRNLSLSGITIQTSTGELLIRNRSGSAMTTYCLGMSCCLAALVVLRYTHHPVNETSRQDDNEQYDRIEEFPVSEFSSGPHLAIRSPPRDAFRGFPFRPLPRQSSIEHEEISMSVLEEAPPVSQQQQQLQQQHQRIEVRGSDSSSEITTDMVNPTRPQTVTFCQRVFAFQLGLLSTVLWIPSLYIPLFTATYHGLGAAFLERTEQAFFLWNLPSVQQELPHDDLFYATILLSFTAISSLILIPVTCSCLGLLAWLGEHPWRQRCHRWLYALQPALGSGITLLITLVIALPTFGVGDSTQICSKLLLNTKCLDVDGRLEMGAWFYALHAIVLQVFVSCTLLWSHDR